jgi:hypothetical protein
MLVKNSFWRTGEFWYSIITLLFEINYMFSIYNYFFSKSYNMSPKKDK